MSYWKTVDNIIYYDDYLIEINWYKNRYTCSIVYRDLKTKKIAGEADLLVLYSQNELINELEEHQLDDEELNHYFPSNQGFYLNLIMVSDKFRNKGIGSALMNEIIKLWKEIFETKYYDSPKFMPLFLRAQPQTTQPLSKLIKFYEKYDFIEFGNKRQETQPMIFNHKKY